MQRIYCERHSWQAVDSRLFAALAEPNRLRIVELLSAAPRSVGEIALTLGLRQPQVTKHLQTLERAGVVAVYPLGQRRIYSLRHEPFRTLRDELAGLIVEHPSEDVLERYRATIATEQERAAARRLSEPRRFRLERRMAAPIEQLWRAWTTTEQVARWWGPRHFRVEEAAIEAMERGRVRLVLAEGDGTRYVSEGVVLAADPPRSLVFELAPIDASGRPMMEARYEVNLREHGPATVVVVTILVRNARPEAVAAVAGIEVGWAQLLDQLKVLVEGGSLDRTAPSG